MTKTRSNPASRYEVIVGNIGTVYSGNNLREGRVTFAEYLSQSESGRGRAGGEDVTLMMDDEPIAVHYGTMSNPASRGSKQTELARRKIKSNPRKRKIKPVSRPSQITGVAPDAELRARRKKTNAGPRGYFANPRTSGINSPFILWAKVDTRDGGFEYGMDAVTPVSWIFGRSRKMPKARYIWTLPETPEILAFIRSQRGKVYVATKNELQRDLAPGGKYRKNPAQPLYKVLARRKPSAPFELVGNFKKKDNAMQYARALHQASPTPIAVKVTT